MAFRMRWPTGRGVITQRFGENPATYRKFGLPGHEGLDFLAPCNAPVYAVAEGLVSDVRLDGFADPMIRPYGNQIRIEHPGGYETVYAHLALVVVTLGQYVRTRQFIGLSGDSGYTQSPHLHLSLKSHGATLSGETGYPYDLIDPEPFLAPFSDEVVPSDPLESSLRVRVQCPDAGYTQVRELPTALGRTIARVDHGATLEALEPPDVVRHKLGVNGQWLWVRITGGGTGWVAARHVALEESNGSPETWPPAEVAEAAFVLVDSQGENLLLRAGPGAEDEEIARFADGTLLRALEDRSAVWTKVGREDAWLRVQAPTGEVGYCAARYLTLPPEAPGEDTPRVILVIVDSQGEPLILRAGPGSDYAELDCISDGTSLRAMESQDAVEAKVGQPDTWLKVQAPTGQVGYCLARSLKLKPFGNKPVIPEPPVPVPAPYVVVDSPDVGLRLRAGPGTEYARIWSMPHKTVLTSLEDPAVTGAKLGRRDEWVHVRTPSLQEGYTAAWYLRHPKREDDRVAAGIADTRAGISPQIFGIHAISAADDDLSRERIRGLYHGTGGGGWILFTEVCGRHPEGVRLRPEIRRALWEWADAGYGVIVRLNNGYEPGGTIPESTFFDDFAETLARWVAIHLKDTARLPASYTWTIQIGNEQNNPREHPGGLWAPIEHTTPELYADAFNRVYERIKAVLPTAIVCPGAVDPFNYSPMPGLGGVRWRPLDYFTTMMEHITALDGIILHAYTHGPDPYRVTHLKRFGDGSGPLGDHYYDFQTYRLFMERIPARWRDLPVYITEMNHIYRPAGLHDQGWINQNVGWVRAVYAEIDRWNQTPYAQQIRCGLLYRWVGDAWSIADKPAIHEDFRQALSHDYRWRAKPNHDWEFAGEMWGSSAEPEDRDERLLLYPDDLTRVRGIDDTAQSVLRAAGILTYEQLAAMTPVSLQRLIGETELQPQHISSWPEQARMAGAGEWERLSRYQEHVTQQLRGTLD